MIENASNFYCVMQSINTEQRNQIFTQLEEKITGMIKNVSDFNYVMQFINEEQRETVRNHFINQLPKMIRNYCFNQRHSVNDSLYNLFGFLTEEQRINIINELQPQLPKVLDFAEDCVAIVHTQDDYDRFLAEDPNNNDWKDLLDDALSLRQMIQNLQETDYLASPAQVDSLLTAIVCNSKVKIKEAIDNILKADLQIIPLGNCHEILNYVSQRRNAILATIVNVSPYWLSRFDELLPLYQERAAFLNSIIDLFIKIIKTKNDLCNCFQLVDGEQALVILKHFDYMLNNISDIRDLLQTLNPELFRAIGAYLLIERLPNLIQTFSDLENLRLNFSTEQCDILYTILSETPSIKEYIITSVDAESALINALSLKEFTQSLSQITSETQVKNILSALQGNDNNLIITAFGDVLNSVSHAWTKAAARKSQCINLILSLSPYWLAKINDAFSTCDIENPFKVDDVEYDLMRAYN